MLRLNMDPPQILLSHFKSPILVFVGVHKCTVRSDGLFWLEVRAGLMAVFSSHVVLNQPPRIFCGGTKIGAKFCFNNGGKMVELGLAGESVDEGCVGEKAVLVLSVAQLSQQLLHVLLGDLVSQVGQQVLQLGQHHGAVAVFVVELEELHEVVVVAGGLGGLGGGLDLGHDLVELGELLALLVDLAKANTALKNKTLLHEKKLDFREHVN